MGMHGKRGSEAGFTTGLRLVVHLAADIFKRAAQGLAVDAAAVGDPADGDLVERLPRHRFLSDPVSIHLVLPVQTASSMRKNIKVP